MFVIRNVFRCRPGKAGAVAEKFRAAHELMRDTGIEPRIMIDEVADFWTVVVEVEVEDLAEFGRVMHERGSREDVKAAMSGYLEMVESGRREIYRVV